MLVMELIEVFAVLECHLQWYGWKWVSVATAFPVVTHEPAIKNPELTYFVFRNLFKVS